MEINWDVIETENFVRSCEQNNVSQEVIDSLRIWAKSVRRQITPRNSRPFISPNNIFEIWMASIQNLYFMVYFANERIRNTSRIH